VRVTTRGAGAITTLGGGGGAITFGAGRGAGGAGMSNGSGLLVCADNAVVIPKVINAAKNIFFMILILVQQCHTG
jgi:hypothetical protein